MTLLVRMAALGILTSLISTCLWNPTCARWRRVLRNVDSVALSMEDKYAVMLCQKQWTHPPSYHMTMLLVDMGDEAIPFLQDKILLEDDDLNVRDIVNVFTLMHPRVADLHDHAGLVPLIHAKAAQVRDPGWRRMALDMIDDAGL